MKPKLALPLVLILFLFWRMTSGLLQVPPEGDEELRLRVSRNFFTLFVEHNLNPAVWPDSFENRTFAPLPQYFAGLSWWILGYSPGQLPEPKYDFSRSFEYNVRQGAWPPDPMLFGGRAIMAYLTLMAAALLCRLGRLISGSACGLIAMTLFGSSPGALLFGRGIMDEPLVVFFSLATIVALVYLARLVTGPVRISRLQLIIIFLAISTAAGLALASKLSALVLFPIISLLLIEIGVWRFVGLSRQKGRPNHLLRDRRLIASMLGAALIPVSATAILLAIYPYFYVDPIYRLVGLFTFRLEVTQGIVPAIPGVELDGLLARVNATFNFALAKQPLIGAMLGPWPQALVFVLGIMLLVKSSLMSESQLARASAMSVLIWAAGTVGGIGEVVSLRLPRYYYPILPVTTLATAIILNKGVQLGTQSIRIAKARWMSAKLNGELSGG